MLTVEDHLNRFVSRFERGKILMDGNIWISHTNGDEIEEDIMNSWHSSGFEKFRVLAYKAIEFLGFQSFDEFSISKHKSISEKDIVKTIQSYIKNRAFI